MNGPTGSSHFGDSSPSAAASSFVEEKRVKRTHEKRTQDWRTDGDDDVPLRGLAGRPGLARRRGGRRGGG